MTIPATGFVHLTSIRTEWSYGGTSGQPPDSLSEYYAGNLNSNANPVTVAHSVNYSSTSQYVPAQPAGKYTPAVPAYTAYYRQFGHKHSSIENTSIYPAIGATGTIYTYQFKTGVDQVGNAGQIPSSGTISFDHFRGTDNNPTTTNRYVSAFYSKQNAGLSGTWSNHIFYFTIGGTWGTQYLAGSSWTTSSCPFRYIDVPAKDGVPATRLYGSDAHQNSGWVTAKNILVHATYPGSVGATTTFSWNTNNNTNINMSGTWNISVTQ